MSTRGRFCSEKTIGEPRLLAADFGVQLAFDPAGRLFAPELGGGALLDLGVYPVSLASMLFGRPASIVSLTTMGRTGVDDQSGMILRYPQGEMACLCTATGAATPTEAGSPAPGGACPCMRRSTNPTT